MAGTNSSSRRTRIPNKPNKPLSLWGIVKNFIGKDMTKVAMPVNFSEPLSMLQRLTEDFDYANVLDRAVNEKDELQLAYVAAFAITSYSTTSERTSKPFNPLLGETFECDRTADLGWRCISEQVSHHPPITAMYCEGRGWTAWQDFSMASKFRGKYIRIFPSGVFHLTFAKSNNHYTWNKVITTVHNVILGNLWVDQTGTMTVTNHKNGWKTIMEFIPYNYYNKEEQRSVQGRIQDENEEVKWVIAGNWDSKIQLSPVTSVEGTKVKPIYKTGPPTVLWERKSLAPDAKNYYYFTLLACQLNEPELGVAPTDSRNRPDQRLMEEGKWEEANTVKFTLEENQRIRRRSEKREPQPLWFKKESDPLSGLAVHVFNGKYWDCKKKKDWKKCPDLFTLSPEIETKQ